MARKAANQESEQSVGLPLDTPLVGHEEPSRAILEAIHGDRMHHAWLLHGPKGVGKARFAAQATAYLVADKARQGSETLDVDLTHPDARLLAQGAHPDAYWIDRFLGTQGKKPPKTIPVANVRETLHKLQATAAYGGWRTLVVDAVDELNVEGANALLKPLEEPSRNTVLFLVAHALNRVLPTIRSRCRHLAFAPLAGNAMNTLAAPLAEGETLHLAVALSGGRAGQVQQLCADPDLLDAYKAFCALAAASGSKPNTQTTAERLAFAASLAGLTEENRALLLSLMEDWLSRRVRGHDEPSPLATPSTPLRPSDKEALATLWSEHMAAIDLRRAINLDLSERIMALFARLDQVYRQG